MSHQMMPSVIVHELRLRESLRGVTRVFEQEQQWNGANDGNPQNPRPRWNTEFAAAFFGLFVFFSHDVAKVMTTVSSAFRACKLFAARSFRQ
jgi:hypothetical protein